jgi:hypothetical protein
MWSWQRRRYSESLRAGRFGDRIPAGARFSAPVYIGPGAHPVSYIIDRGPFPGVKGAGREVNPPTQSAEVNERMELHLCSPYVPSRQVTEWNLPPPYLLWNRANKNYVHPWTMPFLFQRMGWRWAHCWIVRKMGKRRSQFSEWEGIWPVREMGDFTNTM